MKSKENLDKTSLMFAYGNTKTNIKCKKCNKFIKVEDLEYKDKEAYHINCLNRK